MVPAKSVIYAKSTGRKTIARKVIDRKIIFFKLLDENFKYERQLTERRFDYISSGSKNG